MMNNRKFQRMVVTVIIPALNEEISIGSMVIKAKKYADHVIVVDDGSTDDTAEVARDAGADVVKHPRNKGKGEALKTGFFAANQNGTKVIVTIDADGQHNPKDIPRVVEHIISGEADMVIGSRYLNGNIPIYRRIGQKILDLATNMNCGKNCGISDTQSGFRAFAVNTLQAFQFNQNGFSIESEMLTEATTAGLRIKEVDIASRYDVDCNTDNPVIHGMTVLTDIIRDMEFRRPLYYFTIPGIILFAVGFYIGMNFIKDFIRVPESEFWSILLMILLALIGIFLAFTGIISDSVLRLLHKNRK